MPLCARENPKLWKEFVFAKGYHSSAYYSREHEDDEARPILRLELK